jgi:hypothetical protein
VVGGLRVRAKRKTLFVVLDCSVSPGKPTSSSGNVLWSSHNQNVALLVEGDRERKKVAVCHGPVAICDAATSLFTGHANASPPRGRQKRLRA